MTKKSAPPGDDDPQAFRRAMTGVRPLAAKTATAPAARPRVTSRLVAARRRAAAVEQPDTTGLPAVQEAAGHLQFRRQGVREEVMRQLVRGQFRVEAEADLHGMRLPPAQDALREFIADCVSRRLRCVRVIHGKGLRSGPDGPVLRIAVSHWLRQYDAVRAYASARPADGGSGAVYVLLR